MFQSRNPLLLALLPGLVALAACSSAPYPGPDKQGAGLVGGAVTGAGAGAVTGFQLGAATGPGAAVGAGFGALAGSIQGLMQDRNEEKLLQLAARTQRERERSYAQEVLTDHLKRRAELHPGRDIYPADFFFYADELRLRPSAKSLVQEIVKLNKQRTPWSRLVIAAYVKTADEESEYALKLGQRRCQELGDGFVSAGIEPRRIESRVVLVKDAILIDPLDRPDRYSQAFELISMDR